MIQVKHTTEDIRSYNLMFTFISGGEEIGSSVNNGCKHFVFRSHSQNFHQIGSLLPSEVRGPTFAQLYICDSEIEVTNKAATHSGNS